MLQRIIFFFFISGTLAAQAYYDLKHLEVSLRKLGHELLLSSGDSSSRVLAVEREANSFYLKFESNFSFEPERLVELCRDLLSNEDLGGFYIIEVNNCEKDEVIYSFEMAPSFEDEIVPCLGRDQLKACYTISLTFPNLQTSEEPSAEQGSYWYYLMFIPLLAIPIFLRNQRSKPISDAHLHQIGKFQFNQASGTLSKGDVQEELTAKEGELLILLWQAKNSAVEREVLLHKVWGDEGDYVGRTLDVFISRLRKKLLADENLQILNVRGVGYKLIDQN